MTAAGIPQIADKQKRFDATWKLLRQHVRWNGDYAFWAKSGSKVLKEGTGTNADMNFLLIGRACRAAPSQPWPSASITRQSEVPVDLRRCCRTERLYNSLFRQFCRRRLSERASRLSVGRTCPSHQKRKEPTGRLGQSAVSNPGNDT